MKGRLLQLIVNIIIIGCGAVAVTLALFLVDFPTDHQLQAILNSIVLYGKF